MPPQQTQPQPYVPPPSGSPDAIDLRALAEAGRRETGTRVAGQTEAVWAALAAAAEEERARGAAGLEAQGRDLSHRGALADRERSSRFEQAQRSINQDRTAARARLEEAARDRAHALRMHELRRESEVPYAERLDMETSQAIRLAQAEAGIRAQMAGQEEAAMQPRLSDFGQSVVNPFRGQALLGDENQRATQLWNERTGNREAVLEEIRGILAGAEDPNQAMAEVGNFFREGSGPLQRGYGLDSDELASLALWELGYGLA